MIPRMKNNFIRPSGEGESWTLSIDPVVKTFDNYFVESCQAAEEIYNLKEGNLHIMYSGGIDSEYALSIFLHLGIPVTPVIIKLLPDYNNHDIEYALKFCQKKNIKPIIIDINFDDFVESGKFEKVNEVAKSSVIMLPATCYALGLVDGSVICAQNEPHIVKDEKTDIWYYDEFEGEHCCNRYMDEYGIDGTSFFLGYTPEMFASFLMDPRMQDLANNKVPGKLGNNSSKYIIYNRNNNFNLEDRPKFHGYEKILDSKIMEHESLQYLLREDRPYDGTFKIEYHKLIKDLI